MDQPDGLDPTRSCSFCQSTFPEIEELFAAPDGLSICDGCVAFLWETLQAQRAAEGPDRAKDLRPSARPYG